MERRGARNEYRQPLAALLIAVGGVLFISSTNPAGLLLDRGVARQREFAVRAALGAGRGRMLCRMVIREILAHPKLEGVRRFLLATRDAHGLYARFGFKPLAQPDYFMTFHNPNAHPSRTG